jgi:hypothetical protein
VRTYFFSLYLFQGAYLIGADLRRVKKVHLSFEDVELVRVLRVATIQCILASKYTCASLNFWVATYSCLYLH